MKILIIGGSYFLGRVFTLLYRSGHELTLINRGSYSMKEFGVKEYHFDRHDTKALKEIPYDDYDVLIDFCAYQPGDIKTVMDNLNSNFRKYIFVSTADVYKRGITGLKDEKTPYENIRYSGEQGEYISGKIFLEKELINFSCIKGIPYGIVRPSLIYGPYSYTSQESEYIRKIIKGEEIVCPFNSRGMFQLVYVKDVANAIMHIATQKSDSIYNVCNTEISNYSSLFKVLEKLAKDNGYHAEIIHRTVQQVIIHGDFTPYPLMKSETELYDGSKLEVDFDFHYTSLLEGMTKTFNSFKNVYS